jgi:hypothetical protein
MTICVFVRVAEGLVLAADSVVTLSGEVTDPQGNRGIAVVQTFNFANKVSHVKDYPIGVMTWGLASIGERSIQSLIMEFEYDYPSLEENKTFTVRKVAEDLVQFIKKRYDDAFSSEPPEVRGLGVFIGGFSHDAFFSEQYQYEYQKSDGLIDPRPNNPNGTPQFGAGWYGMTDALVRLVKGYDPGSLEELVARGVDRGIIEQWVNDNVSELPLVFAGMPIQDAIDFAEYCVNVVIGRWRFGPGAPICGGNIDIAVLRPQSFTWAQRKQWSIKD